jgi:hypothetical protein
LAATIAKVLQIYLAACPKSESGVPKSKAASAMIAPIAMKLCVELIVF